MAILNILKYPDPRLKEVSRPVEAIDDDILRLIEDMVETMYTAPGIGLAAPQVAVPKRVVVLDIDHEHPGKNLLKLINPEIRAADGEAEWEEGCLSVIDFTAEVRRAAKVEVFALDEKGQETIIEGDGLLAVALQHEIDHLDGKLFIDRISRLKRDLYTRRLKKALRQGPEHSERSRVLI
jgi:peptide deformylase